MMFLPIYNSDYTMFRSKENNQNIINWHLKFTSCYNMISQAKCGTHSNGEKFVWGISNLNFHNNFSKSTK